MAFHRPGTNSPTLYQPGDTALCFTCGQNITGAFSGAWLHPDGQQWHDDLNYHGKVIGKHMAFPETDYPRQLQIAPDL